MAKQPGKSQKNRLIEGLPKNDRLALLARCEDVELPLAEVVCERGQAFRYAYFPIDSFISLVSVIDGSPGVEVGMIGSEGMVGAQLALGIATAPLHGLVQGDGSAWRIKAADLRRLMTKSETLRAMLDRYLFVLMSHDRAHSDQFQVTQEFMAYMLGVRRVSVTTAARALQQQELISYRRGDVTIVDRQGLEAAACGCYADDRVAYSAVMS